MTNKAFPPSNIRATKAFELVHSDIVTYSIESYKKIKYSIVFYDDYSSHAWTINLHTKDAALQATKYFLVMVETIYETRIQKWMSDARGGYTSRAFTTLMKEKGIEVLQSIPHVHQQNGRAERLIRMLREKAEIMRLEACLPQSWWEFTLDHATHVYNRTPVHCLNWQTPYQTLKGDKPYVNHLRVFGCGIYVYLPAEVQDNKLTPKSEMMTYLRTLSGPLYPKLSTCLRAPS